MAQSFFRRGLAALVAVAALLATLVLGTGTGVAQGRVCASGTPGLDYRINSLKLPPRPHPPQVIAVFFPEDAVRMVVEDDGTLPVDQMMVGLASGTGWAKELTAWNACDGRVKTVHQEGRNATPRWMHLSKQEADTIIFRKPKIFGIWHDMYWFWPNEFWAKLGGKKVTFTWVKD